MRISDWSSDVCSADLLRAHGIQCTAWGAYRAAENGHVDVIRHLRAHGIHCTSDGANMAAGNGHLAVVRELRSHGINSSVERRVGKEWVSRSKYRWSMPPIEKQSEYILIEQERI